MKGAHGSPQGPGLPGRRSRLRRNTWLCLATTEPGLPGRRFQPGKSRRKRPASPSATPGQDSRTIPHDPFHGVPGFALASYAAASFRPNCRGSKGEKTLVEAVGIEPTSEELRLAASPCAARR